METAIATSPKEKFLAPFAQTKSALSNATNWVSLAQEALGQLELPTTRVEDWKYTRTVRISQEHWELSQAAAAVNLSDYAIPGLDAHVLVFVDGVFRNDLSNHSLGTSLSVEAYDRAEFSFASIFSAMNVAHCTGYIRVSIAKGLELEKPVLIHHIASLPKGAALPVIEVEVASSAKAHFIEKFSSEKTASSFTQRMLLVNVAENGELKWDKIQMEGAQNFLMNEEHTHLSNDSRFTINTLTVDGLWVRNTLNIALDGSNVEANLHGIYLPRNQQFVDNHTKVDHLQPHSNSNELYKGLINDQATGVFNGKVYVRKDAQKTNAYQSNANVLLHDDAQMNTKPELEIYADDVKCSHGTTTGRMDENAIFYLRSRGMSEENAQRLLTSAFIHDVLNKVDNQVVREYVLRALAERNLLVYLND
jgi:Fe-S cluster assembly protein SufD